MAQAKRPAKTRLKAVQQDAPAPAEMTAEARSAVLRWLNAGMPIDIACRLASVPEEALLAWRIRSRQGKDGYEGLEDDVQHALAEGEAIHVARIAEAGRTNWRAAAWLLERMNPDKWGERVESDGAAHSPDAASDLPGL